MAIASPIWGALADRYGRKPMVERSMFGGAVVLLLMTFVRSAEELVLQALVGVVLGGIIPAISALLAGYFSLMKKVWRMGWTTRLRSGSLDAHRLDANGQVCYKYIYVGPLERSHYPSAALDKFDHIMDVVYQQGAVTIYKRR